jgi:hypothetical protein
MATRKGFDEWIKNAQVIRHDAGWRTWPKAAVAELDQVLELMDAGKARVSVTAMIRRLKDAHGVVATRASLLTFVKARGRVGWTNR